MARSNVDLEDAPTISESVEAGPTDRVTVGPQWT